MGQVANQPAWKREDAWIIWVGRKENQKKGVWGGSENWE